MACAIITENIKQVVFFDNGNVLVFNEKGEQMVELQGFIMEVIPKLAIACDEDTQFQYMEWETGITIDCDFAWWFN